MNEERSKTEPEVEVEYIQVNIFKKMSIFLTFVQILKKIN